jgi:type III pantothenate kinase
VFLALDIGNTNITIGLFDMNNKRVSSNPLRVWRISTLKNQTSDEYAIILMSMFFYSNIDVKKLTNVAIASVVPSLDAVFERLVKKYFGKETFFINHKNSGGLVFLNGISKEIGADRIADVVAINFIYGCDSVVIDFGTATTFDCIDFKGRYIGGIIVPGLSVLTQSLSLKTAQLPYVKIKKPLKSIGTTTIECMQSGLYFGYVGIIKELIARIKGEMKVKHIIATGGLAGLMLNDIEEIEIFLPNLTLDGIRIVWERSDSKL